MSRPVALALLVLLALPVRAQQTLVFSALPVLELPAAPDLGGAAVGRATADPRAVLHNPARLGLGAPGAAVAGAPAVTWFGESRFGVSAATWSVEHGAIRAGVGLAQGVMSSDTRALADGTPFQPVDRYRALSGGAGLAFGPADAFRAAVGATARYVTSTDAPVWNGTGFSVGQIRGMTADAGAMASVDVAALAGRPHVGVLRPALDVTAGYAQSHLGGAVQYSGFERQTLPRTAAVGWSARAGLDLPTAVRPVRLVEAEVAVQTERRLITAGPDGNVTTARVTGGMRAGQILTARHDDLTTARSGVRLALAETLALSWGGFEGGGYREVRTRGVEVSAAGAFALAASRLAPGPLADALGRTDLRLARETVFAGTPEASSRTTLTLVVRG